MGIEVTCDQPYKEQVMSSSFLKRDVWVLVFFFVIKVDTLFVEEIIFVITDQVSALIYQTITMERNISNLFMIS